MVEKVLQAALAGLLHDVGKIAQRAGERGNLESKDAQEMYGRYHAMLTANFLAKILPFGDEVRLPAANHHIPKSYMDWVVKVADLLSAGERADPPDDEDTRLAQPRQLLSIFNIITADGECWKENKDKWRFFPLKKPELDEKTIFPGKALPDGDVWNIYKNLWDDFNQKSAGLKSLSELEPYLEAMLALLQHYGWCMPSAYFRTRPDVSLYDHSRMTAALAACLVNLPEVDLQRIAQNPEMDKTEVALLVGGDISGVQGFIYTITNKGATSALRGRSFYLQLLTEAAARFILRELELPYTNLIYAGGGNFYLLARPADFERLANARQKLSRILYQHHQGDLYIAVAGIPLKACDFMLPTRKNPNGTAKRHPLSDKWGELARKLTVVKNKRFADLEEEELMVLFTPQGHGGNQDKQCQVCGREHPQTNEVKRKDDEDAVRKCPACASYEKLGEKLRKANYIGWNMMPPTDSKKLTGQEIPGTYEDVLRELGFTIEVTDSIDKVKDFSRIWALNDEAFEKALSKIGGKVLIRRLLVNVTPIISRDEIIYLKDKVDDLPDEKSDNPIKPFGAMAYQSKGINRLGIFRTDVDNLGKLFAEGLGDNATLSRIASLSFAISLFFEGWVGIIAERMNQKRQDEDQKRIENLKNQGKFNKDTPLYGAALYAIYSGGDDLFFVGSWDELVEFAWQVNEDLKQYTGGHPGIHLSGGMVLVTDKYPLAKAARYAEEAESAAKEFEWWDYQGQKRKKNVFTFLEQPLPWSEFNNARELKAQLKNLDTSKRAGVIRKLLLNYALYAQTEKKRRQTGKDRKANKKPQTLYGPWNWRIVYMLRRTFGQETPVNSIEDQRLVSDFHVLPGKENQPDYTRMDWIGVASRWAELEDR